MEAGNAQKMREALEAMLDEHCSLCDVPNQMSDSGCSCDWRNRWDGCQSKAVGLATAVLTAPPRNCDVGSAEEQARRYAQHCDTYLRDDGTKPCTDCSCCGKIPFGKCEFAWAQMPYKEGGAE